MGKFKGNWDTIFYCVTLFFIICTFASHILADFFIQGVNTQGITAVVVLYGLEHEEFIQKLRIRKSR